ncbi:GNAT family N-acetyltransferase [Brachybacterium endophyticum]|uniref:GNAT family N-acetyltransferase n=1 Tax=Brachybacterium endophyticum TaxID=2182385 RepID=A0A2U2RNV5_9MICO|nr:GNAT family N-acetyltransferase [Brachybacterium endophyticum]PWH07550.1 GNAT family N-acetyltransferase [Brachybacterium endophyticum]
MIRLTAPDPARFEAWRDCLLDFAGGPVDGSGYIAGQVPEPTRDEFVRYLSARSGEEDPSVPLPPGRVRCSNRWIIEDSWEDGGPVLGFLSIRHVLNDFLLRLGGHIGYSVRPSQRRKGIASGALTAGLQEARERGIDPVLVTCEEGNLASRLTIEHRGGQYENSIEDHRRYWFGAPPWPSDVGMG